MIARVAASTLVILTACVHTAAAQTTVLRGHVFDETTREPVADAAVRLWSFCAEDTTYTDSLGVYAFPDASPGVHEVSVRTRGFVPRSGKPVIVRTGVVEQMDFGLRPFEPKPTPDWLGQIRLTGLRQPVDLDDAVSALKEAIPEQVLTAFAQDEEGESWMSFAIGMSLRNYWGLWGGSPLARYFTGIGVSHPDDMSAIVITTLWRSLNGEPIRLDGQVQFYRDYWETYGDLKDTTFDACPSGVRVTSGRSYADTTGVDRWVRLGRCRDDGTLWAYERDRGWFRPWCARP